jgi:predicted aspartyl protease
MSLQQFLLKKGYSKIKLHFTKTNHFELRAKINGEKGRFILDTGASNTCVDFTFASKFNLQAEDSEVKAAGAGAIDMLTQVSKKNTIKIGKWSSKKVSIILFDLTHVNTALTNHNANLVHGIIGADILKKTNAIIDYNKKYLYIKL